MELEELAEPGWWAEAGRDDQPLETGETDWVDAYEL